MGEGLSFGGLRRQTGRVLAARWPWLLAVAALWGLCGWLLLGLYSRMLSSGSSGDDPSLLLFSAAEALAAGVGAALMIGVVARTGQPRRPLGVAALHLVFAAATVLAAMLLHGVVGMALQDAAYRLGQPGANLAALGYVAGLLSPVYQYGLFIFLGMAVPAATERMVSPCQAALVSLKLTEGRRLWIAIIAVLWSVGMLVPMYGALLIGTGLGLGGTSFGLNVAAPVLTSLIRPLLLAGQMLTAVGIGVLYLELRRLRAAAVAVSGVEADSE